MRQPGTFNQISVGYYHNCALRTDGTVTCWGRDNYQQLIPPIHVAGDFVGLSAGGNHTCGIKKDGTLECWGYNNFNQSNAPTVGLTGM